MMGQEKQKIIKQRARQANNVIFDQDQGKIFNNTCYFIREHEAINDCGITEVIKAENGIWRY